MAECWLVLESKWKGKERPDVQKTVVCYKLFTWVRQCMSLEAQEHFTWEDSMWMTETPYPTWLFLTLPPGSIKDTRSWQWQWHRVNMSMTHIKVTWRVESSVLRISGESQGWWPMYIIQGTCKVETGRMVVWGELDQNDNEILSQPIKAGLCQMCLSSQLRVTFGGAEVGEVLAGVRPWVQMPVTPKKQNKTKKTPI
jgi:hypothetical protein